jgi:hypothetical protein
VKDETVFRLVVKRAKKRDSLNMVPVEMGDENVGGNRTLARLAAELMSQSSEAGAAIENKEATAEAHLDTGSIAAIT